MSRASMLATTLLVMGLVSAAAQSASAQVIPRHCGMRAGSETFGSIGVGSVIVLGRHSAWAGDDNWATDMNPFVGRTARVTSLDGVDSAGCPGVRVDADGGQWFWRIRDAQLAGPPPDPIPRSCGMSASGVSYGAIRIGSAIVLGRHTPWRGDANWADEMGRYVGTTAVVTSLEGVDSAGCPVVRVNVDGGQYYWRLRDAQFGAVPPPAAIPTQCDMGTAFYGPIGVGTMVTLGMHSAWRGDANWASEMGRWVGQRATVTSLGGTDSAGCPVVHVNVDGGQYFWRIRDMRL